VASSITSAWLTDRITATKAQILVYEDAILALGGANGVKSYTLDTGQTRQTVTKEDMGALNDTLNGLYNRLATLDARLNGTGNNFIGGASW